MIEPSPQPGQIVILNGAPRSGKSSIVAAVQETFPGPWINLGVDVAVLGMTPSRYRPGIGLRPGGERPDLEPLVPVLYAALYDSIAAHGRLGLNVIADVGHHDAYSQPLGILPDCARRLAGLPVLFVGVHCPLDVIMARRDTIHPGREHTYLAATAADLIPEPVRRWQAAVHTPGLYDLEVDTSLLTPAECAAAIWNHLQHGPPPTAFPHLAAQTTPAPPPKAPPPFREGAGG